MYFIEETSEFDKWLRKLKDLKAKSKILFRIQKLEKKVISAIINPLDPEFWNWEYTMPKVTECTFTRKKERL